MDSGVHSDTNSGLGPDIVFTGKSKFQWKEDCIIFCGIFKKKKFLPFNISAHYVKLYFCKSLLFTNCQLYCKQNIKKIPPQRR